MSYETFINVSQDCRSCCCLARCTWIQYHILTAPNIMDTNKTARPYLANISGGNEHILLGATRFYSASAKFTEGEQAFQEAFEQ